MPQEAWVSIVYNWFVLVHGIDPEILALNTETLSKMYSTAKIRLPRLVPRAKAETKVIVGQD